MCMYLVDAMHLGNRLIGYEVYESKSMGFMGMTEKQILDKLNRNENGDRLLWQLPPRKQLKMEWPQGKWKPCWS